MNRQLIMTLAEIQALEAEIWIETNELHLYDIEPGMDTCWLPPMPSE